MAEEVLGEPGDLGLNEDVPSGATEADDVYLQAKKVVQAFVKTVKAFRLYPPENPTLVALREQAFKKFQVFLSKHHFLPLHIGEYDFLYQGKVVYENQDLKSSLAFLLYKDGLRELRFMEGVEEWEISELIDVIKKTDHLNQMEDDLVTLMWEKDFIHISYVATDEYLEETPVLVPENVEQFRKGLVFEPPPRHAEADLWDPEAEGEVDYFEILARSVKEPPQVQTDRSVYFLTSDEMENLRKEVEAEIAPGSVFNVIEILLEIMALEKEEGPFEESLGVLFKLLEALITLGEFQRAADLLTRLNIMLNTYELKEWQAKLIQKLIEQAGESPRIERLGKVLEKNDGLRPEEVGSYLLLLKPNSVQPLIHLLGELSNSKMRRVVCDALCEIGKNHVELISPFVDDPRWYLVRNIAYVLGRIGKDLALPATQKALTHPEPRVRREAVQALGLIGGSRAAALLKQTLQDGDIRIRCLAALNFAGVAKKASIPPLLEIVQSKDFQKKEAGEIKAFFDAIGMVGANEAVGVLQRILEQRSWFSTGKIELRLGAASALALIGTDQARAVLESGKNSKDESIRRACLQAMDSKQAGPPRQGPAA